MYWRRRALVCASDARHIEFWELALLFSLLFKRDYLRTRRTVSAVVRRMFSIFVYFTIQDLSDAIGNIFLFLLGCDEGNNGAWKWK